MFENLMMYGKEYVDLMSKCLSPLWVKVVLISLLVLFYFMDLVENPETLISLRIIRKIKFHFIREKRKKMNHHRSSVRKEKQINFEITPVHSELKEIM